MVTPSRGGGLSRRQIPREVLIILSTQVAELEAQAATEPTPVSEKEGPGQALEQLESLVQTKDQVSTEHVSMCVPRPHLP